MYNLFIFFQQMETPLNQLPDELLANIYSFQTYYDFNLLIRQLYHDPLIRAQIWLARVAIMYDGIQLGRDFTVFWGAVSFVTRNLHAHIDFYKSKLTTDELNLEFENCVKQLTNVKIIDKEVQFRNVISLIGMRSVFRNASNASTPIKIELHGTTIDTALNILCADFEEFTTVLLSAGDYHISGSLCNECLTISRTMNIVGDPNVERDKINILGQINITGINCHLQNLRVHSPGETRNKNGVYGEESFTMENVIVERYRRGVTVSGAGAVAECRNVLVQHCGSGFCAQDMSTIRLMDNTKVQNCDVGLEVGGMARVRGFRYVGSLSPIIEIKHPLTLKLVSVNNTSVSYIHGDHRSTQRIIEYGGTSGGTSGETKKYSDAIHIEYRQQTKTINLRFF